MIKSCRLTYLISFLWLSWIPLSVLNTSRSREEGIPLIISVKYYKLQYSPPHPQHTCQVAWNEKKLSKKVLGEFPVSNSLISVIRTIQVYLSLDELYWTTLTRQTIGAQFTSINKERFHQINQLAPFIPVRIGQWTVTNRAHKLSWLLRVLSYKNSSELQTRKVYELRPHTPTRFATLGDPRWP